MRFVTRSEVAQRFKDRSVAIVGSGPGVLDNRPGTIDGCEIVVRINNYKLSAPTGIRTDVYYSFYGTSIRKTAGELRTDGVTLCMCKCPNAHAINSEWHRLRGKMIGVDYRPLYERRQHWWFCDTYIPTIEEFMVGFDLLGKRMPTTGFSAILDIISFQPRAIYLTGFDFFRSGVHSVSERWNPGRPDDPIGHVPERELKWLADNIDHLPITVDQRLWRELNGRAA